MGNCLHSTSTQSQIKAQELHKDNELVPSTSRSVQVPVTNDSQVPSNSPNQPERPENDGNSSTSPENEEVHAATEAAEDNRPIQHEVDTDSVSNPLTAQIFVALEPIFEEPVVIVESNHEVSVVPEPTPIASGTANENDSDEYNEQIYFDPRSGPTSCLYDKVKKSGGKLVFEDPQPITSDPFPTIVNLTDVPAPPRHRNWMEKEGHQTRSWKRRYFVLDHGFLSYFRNPLDRPPYGEEIKGQVCLAGYRVSTVITPKKVSAGEDPNKAIRRRSSRRGSAILNLMQSSTSEGNNGIANDGNNSTEDEGYVIKLEFCPQTVDMQVLDELRQRNIVLSARLSSQSSLSNPYETHTHFSFACSTQSEQSVWLDAIHAHILYMEILLFKHKDDVFRPSYASRPVSTASKGSVSSPQVLKQRRTSGMGSFIASSLDSITTSVAESTIGTATTTSVAHSPGVKLRRMSSTQLSSAKWSIFVDFDAQEKIKLVGKMEKPNPVGYCHVRDLILIDAPATPTSDSKRRLNKRLFYVDGSVYAIKGEMVWERSSSAINKQPKAIKKGKDGLEVHDPLQQITWLFYPMDDLTVDEWIVAINEGSS